MTTGVDMVDMTKKARAIKRMTAKGVAGGKCIDMMAMI